MTSALASLFTSAYGALKNAATDPVTILTPGSAWEFVDNGTEYQITTAIEGSLDLDLLPAPTIPAGTVPRMAPAPKQQIRH